MSKDNILKPAGFLLIITTLVAVLNFVYNIIMGRMLSVADFGDLRALFSILMILSVPTSAIQTMMAKFSAEYHQLNLGKLKTLSLHTLFAMLALGLVLIAVFGWFSRPMADYLKVSSPKLVFLLGPLMLFTLVGPLILGIYQGRQRFLLLGVNGLVGTILKLLFSAGFVYLGYAALGALYGLLISMALITLVFGLMLITQFYRDKTPKEAYRRQDIYSYSGYALGVLICYSVVSQIDLLIVKHKFLPEEAGLYACAALIGKGFLFLPVPVVTVLFPKVVENNRMGKSSFSILNKSLLISFLLCIIGVALCFLFTPYLINIFGVKYAGAGYLIKIFGLAMTPLALFFVLMNYFLSEYKLNFFYYCFLACLLGTAILFYLPKTLSQFLLVLGWFGLLIFILPLIYILIKEKEVAAGSR